MREYIIVLSPELGLFIRHFILIYFDIYMRMIASTQNMVPLSPLLPKGDMVTDADGAAYNRFLYKVGKLGAPARRGRLALRATAR